MSKNVILLAILILALGLFASCGGGAASISLDQPTPSVDNGGGNGSSNGGGNAGSNVFAGLPAEPKGKAISGATDILVVPGADAFTTQNATVDGTTLVLTSTEADLALGLYKVEGLAGKKVTGFNIEMQPATIDTVYSVGVSNFSDGVWDFPVSSSLPEFEYHFTDDMQRRTSALGNFYFVVVTAGGNVATVLQTTVFSRLLEPGEEEMPVFGDDIAASEGLADKIVVQWAAVAGAASYELWRMADVEGVDEVPELLTTLPAVQDQASYSYEDFAITLSTEYKYRIRGLNEAGSGAFSRWASGWAGTTPPPDNGGGGDEGIELLGTLEVIGETSIQVNGVAFATDDATIWLDDLKAVTDKGSFSVGLQVEVDARSDNAGGWIANVVQMEDGAEPPVDELTLLNAIEALDGSSITVGATAFAITIDTQWLDINNLPAVQADFLVGDMVEITGDADGLGGWNARTVKKEDVGAGAEIQLTGAIEALTETSITVNATEFAITIDTLWQDNAGLPLTQGDFMVGDLVEIKGLDNGAGGWNATLVKQQDVPGGGEIDVLGLIEALDGTSITVDGTLFATNELTVWEDLNHDPADPSQFSLGMLVSVSGTADGAGGWIADRVRMED